MLATVHCRPCHHGPSSSQIKWKRWSKDQWLWFISHDQHEGNLTTPLWCDGGFTHDMGCIPIGFALPINVSKTTPSTCDTTNSFGQYCGPPPHHLAIEPTTMHLNSTVEFHMPHKCHVAFVTLLTLWKNSQIFPNFEFFQNCIIFKFPHRPPWKL